MALMNPSHLSGRRTCALPDRIEVALLVPRNIHNVNKASSAQLSSYEQSSCHILYPQFDYRRIRAHNITKGRYCTEGYVGAIRIHPDTNGRLLTVFFVIVNDLPVLRMSILFLGMPVRECAHTEIGSGSDETLWICSLAAFVTLGNHVGVPRTK